MNQSGASILAIEKFRDFFAYRKNCNNIVIYSQVIPNKPHEASFLMYEKWIECIHIDLYEIHYKAHLISIDSGKLHERFLAEQAAIKLECEKVTQYYGSLSRAQKQHFDSLLNRTLKSPTHSIDGEKELLQKYSNDNIIKSILLNNCKYIFNRNWD
jgi:hypothetical protein